MNLVHMLFIFVFLCAPLRAMQKSEGSDGNKPNDSLSNSTRLTTLPVSVVTQPTRSSYLQLLPADILRHLWLFFSRLTQVPDNHGDLVMQTHARARDFSRMICKLCNVDIASHIDANRSFLAASESFVRAFDDEVYSFYLPNHIGLACALGTHGAREALKKEIDSQMLLFKDLPQDKKNKLLLDVMRRLPSKAIVRKMLHYGAQVNLMAESSHFTPLRFAVEEVKVKTVRRSDTEAPQIIKKPRTGLVKLLLKRGAKIDTGDRTGTTPLMRAAILGHVKLISLMAPKSNAINQLNKFEYNALSYAAKSGNPESVKILLDNRARVIFVGENQQKNVFVSAVEGNSPHVLQMLLYANNGGVSAMLLNVLLGAALIRAAALGNIVMLQQLLQMSNKSITDDGQCIDFKPDTLYENESALTAALRNDHPEAAKVLIEYAWDRYFKQTVDKSRSLALAVTVSKLYDRQLTVRSPEKIIRFKEVLNGLLEDDNPNPLGKALAPSACFFAAHNQDLELLRHLLNCADARGILNGQLIALNEALEHSSKTAVHTILRTIVNVNNRDAETGETVFFKTVATIKSEVIEIIDYLLAAGADAKLANSNKLTPAHSVMANPDEKSRLHILDELHKRSISIDSPDNFGDTPLHAACSRKPFMINTVAKLLQYGADPNARNQGGNTPLIHAADLGSEELVSILLLAGADPSIRNNSGCGALTKAARNGSRNMIAMLVASGRAKIKDFNDQMLRAATKGNNISLMKELVEKFEADINAESSSIGNTPLHKGVNSWSREAVAFLLDKGADACARNRNGETPLELSMMSNDSEIMERLTHHKH